MSLEKELSGVFSEAPGKDFAAVRKAMRRPMVNLDQQIHKIDQFLNVTKQDPSRLDSTVKEIEKSFDAAIDPLKQVRTGVQKLKTAAGDFEADYVPGTGKEAPTAPQRRAADTGKAPAKSPVQGVRRSAASPEEERYLNRVVTDIEMVNNQEDKVGAARQGYLQYRKAGGQMNQGEFFKALIQKLRLPGEGPQESSVQRRKLV